VRQVIGLDITPSLLALGAQRLDEAGITNVHQHRGSRHQNANQNAGLR